MRTITPSLDNRLNQEKYTFESGVKASMPDDAWNTWLHNLDGTQMPVEVNQKTVQGEIAWTGDSYIHPGAEMKGVSFIPDKSQESQAQDRPATRRFEILPDLPSQTSHAEKILNGSFEGISVKDIAYGKFRDIEEGLKWMSRVDPGQPDIHQACDYQGVIVYDEGRKAEDQTALTSLMLTSFIPKGEHRPGWLADACNDGCFFRNRIEPSTTTRGGFSQDSNGVWTVNTDHLGCAKEGIYMDYNCKVNQGKSKEAQTWCGTSCLPVTWAQNTTYLAPLYEDGEVSCNEASRNALDKTVSVMMIDWLNPSRPTTTDDKRHKAQARVTSFDIPENGWRYKHGGPAFGAQGNTDVSGTAVNVEAAASDVELVDYSESGDTVSELSDTESVASVASHDILVLRGVSEPEDDQKE